MKEVVLNRWGNSVGFRIPTEIFKQIHGYIGEKFIANPTPEGGILFTPAKHPRAGWQASLDAIAVHDKDGDLLNIENQFDQDEWTW